VPHPYGLGPGQSLNY